MIAISLPVYSRDILQRRSGRLTRPKTNDQLHSYIRAVLGFNIPRRAMEAGHDAPFDYVTQAFFEERQPRDMVVWAGRGAGKTQLAAIVTLLDMIFKPGIQVRILGGSFEQSSKMHRYLARMLESDVLHDLVAGHLTLRHVELRNGSRVEVLSQSECSVRGQRVHKLRCDEVELFDPAVWEAAQMVTRSGRCGSIHVRASIESLSTMHRSYGLMQKLVRESDPMQRRIFRWSVMDTLRPCDELRSCESCRLWDECRGRAKSPDVRGFFSIDDAIQQKGRIAPRAWQAEMLCERPSVDDMVYPEFDEQVHVFGDETEIVQASLSSPAGTGTWIGGIDFGFRAPTVLLWGFVNGEGAVHIVDELMESGMITEKFIAMTEERSKRCGRGRPAWIGADPAGHHRSEHTGLSTIALWKRAGWSMRTRALEIEPGIEAVRRRFMTADGKVRLRIHKHCQRLIESLRKYRYPALPKDGVFSARSLAPFKDGNDHAADALRYMITNLDDERPGIDRRLY